MSKQNTATEKAIDKHKKQRDSQKIGSVGGVNWDKRKDKQ